MRDYIYIFIVTFLGISNFYFIHIFVFTELSMFKYGNLTILEVIYGPVTVLQNELICGYLKLNIKCVLIHFISDIMI